MKASSKRGFLKKQIKYSIMKKIIILLNLLFSIVLLGQEKITIGIMPFTYESSAANSNDVISIQEAVTDAFVKARRFIVVDRSKMQQIKEERELQKSEDFIDSKILAQSSNLGAQFLISGHVVSAVVTQSTYTDTKTGQTKISGYTAKLIVVIKVIDVETGQVTKSETIQPKGGSLLGTLTGTAPSSPQGAISKAIKDIESKIDDFVSENFPVLFQIIEIQEISGNGSAVKILISGGSAFGLKKNDKLIVVENVETEVSGKIMVRRKNIGEIKVELVEDENFSICSVKTGGIELNSRFVAKAKLNVITK